MVSIASVRRFALSFPETEELPHFHLSSFRVKKKIFVTMDEKIKRIMVKLSIIDQSVFCKYDSSVIYPVPGAWGKRGATYIELDKIKLSMLKDAVKTAYYTVDQVKLRKTSNK